MHKNKFATARRLPVLACAFGALSVLLSQSVNAQTSNEKAELRLRFDVPFSGYKSAMPAMKNLLGLKLADENLRLRRDWTGEPEDEGRDHPRNRAGAIRKAGFKKSPVSNAFLKATKELGCTGMAGSTSGDRPDIISSGSDYSCTVTGHPGGLRFNFWKLTSPSQQFSMDEYDDGKLVIRYSCEQDFVQFYQSKDKSVQLAGSVEGQTFSYSAPNFKAMTVTHERAIQNLFRPLLEHIGIGLPLNVDSPDIKKYISSELITLMESETIDIAELVKSLGAEKFTEREKATEQLRSSAKIFREKIEHYIADKENSTEARMRLTGILKSVKPTDAQRTIQKLISANGLMESKDYLFSLLKDADGKLAEAIYKHLMTLNHESNRQDIEAEYKTWQERKKAGG